MCFQYDRKINYIVKKKKLEKNEGFDKKLI